jgi:quercetin dioxygenase-like cupin family protein
MIHYYKGNFDWEGVSLSHYPSEEMKGVSVRWLISSADGATNFAMRYFEIEPGGRSSLDKHAHDHGVMILRGKGLVVINDKEFEIGFGDIVYIPPYEMHQFKNIGDEPFGFICVIPPKYEEKSI